MPHPPKVSVVIPAYRGGPMLRRAVESMVTQQFEQLEILIVSDGSDDPMSDLEDADTRVRIVRMDHRGVSATRNAGLLESSTDFVAFMDEDDIAMPRRIKLQYEALVTHPEAGNLPQSGTSDRRQRSPCWSPRVVVRRLTLTCSGHHSST